MAPAIPGSPYDLAELGYQPVRIETPAGRAEYVRAQREFAQRSQVLRRRLVAECDRLLSAAAASPGAGLLPTAAVTPVAPPAVTLSARESSFSAPAPSPG
jgi:hypothetical protein